MNNDRVYIRIHGEDHRFIEFRIYEEDYELTISEFIEQMKEG